MKSVMEILWENMKLITLAEFYLTCPNMYIAQNVSDLLINGDMMQSTPAWKFNLNMQDKQIKSCYVTIERCCYQHLRDAVGIDKERAYTIELVEALQSSRDVARLDALVEEFVDRVYNAEISDDTHSLRVISEQRLPREPTEITLKIYNPMRPRKGKFPPYYSRILFLGKHNRKMKREDSLIWQPV